MSNKEGRTIRRRFALLIGISEYDHPDEFQRLPQTINDVAELAHVLTQFHYEVRTLHCYKDNKENHIKPVNIPTKKNILAELENIKKIFGPGDLLLIHFGGHGVVYNKKAYLVPSDGRDSNLPESAIDLEEFKRCIVETKAQAQILFLDTCHAGNKRVRGAGGMSPEFERHIFLEAEGTATLAACMQHEVAWNNGKNGVFTHYLLEGLKGKAAQKGIRFITFDDLRYYVTDKVRTWANARGYRQTPSSNSKLVGDLPIVELEEREIGITKKAAFPDWPRNPFTEMLAIRDSSRFIGRESETRRLWALLQGGSVALRGEPKIGKSSMMLHIARRWASKLIGPINFDQLGSPDDLYKNIAGYLGLKNHDWGSICEALENSEALLLLDELDVAPRRGITHEDLSHFRAVCESNRGFKILAVSRSPLKDVYPDPGMGSPFFNLLQPLPLGTLKRDEALSLLEHPWIPDAVRFNPAVCENLLAIAGVHPFKLQRAAFHCYENLFDPDYHWQEAYRQEIEQML